MNMIAKGLSQHAQPTRLLPGRVLAAVSLGFLLTGALGAAQDDATTPPVQDDETVAGPGPAPVDAFHPDGATTAKPLYGGRAIVHMASLPKHMNYATENSSYTRRMLYEVHETLLQQHWEYHDFRPRLAKSLVVEDMLVLVPGAEDRYEGVVDVRIKNPDEAQIEAVPHVAAKALYGQVTGGVDGAPYTVTPVSKGHALSDTVTVDAADVASHDAGTVFTFELR